MREREREHERERERAHERELMSESQKQRDIERAKDSTKITVHNDLQGLELLGMVNTRNTLGNSWILDTPYRMAWAYCVTYDLGEQSQFSVQL